MNRNVKSLLVALATFFVASAAFAQETAAGSSNGLAALAAGLCIAVAAFGGALAQGRAATAALEGIARNPAASGKLLGPMIIGLALIESLVIYAFLVAFIKIKV